MVLEACVVPGGRSDLTQAPASILEGCVVLEAFRTKPLEAVSSTPGCQQGHVVTSNPWRGCDPGTSHWRQCGVVWM